MSNPPEPKIYTRSGDRGQTSLLSGRRVPKHSPRVEAYGTVDELICALAVARAACVPAAGELAPLLLRLQDHLMVVAARVATEEPGVLASLPALPPGAIAELEAEIDRMTAAIPPLRSFILPGGAALSAQIQLARTVCRRAERRLSELADAEEVAPEALRYVNRLSDWLFTAGRYANHLLGQEDVPWQPR